MCDPTWYVNEFPKQWGMFVYFTSLLYWTNIFKTFINRNCIRPIKGQCFRSKTTVQCVSESCYKWYYIWNNCIGYFANQTERTVYRVSLCKTNFQNLFSMRTRLRTLLDFILKLTIILKIVWLIYGRSWFHIRQCRTVWAYLFNLYCTTNKHLDIW